MLLKCYTQYASKFGKPSSGHRLEKLFLFHFQRKAMLKNIQTTTQLHISSASKVMLKILQSRLQQYMNWKLPVILAWCSKSRGARDQIANICWIIERTSSRKTSVSALLTMSKPLTVWITTSFGKFLKRWEYQITLIISWENCMQVKKQ